MPVLISVTGSKCLPLSNCLNKIEVLNIPFCIFFKYTFIFSARNKKHGITSLKPKSYTAV